MAIAAAMPRAGIINPLVSSQPMRRDAISVRDPRVLKLLVRTLARKTHSTVRNGTEEVEQVHIDDEGSDSDGTDETDGPVLL
jgi:hypothetical protein